MLELGSSHCWGQWDQSGGTSPELHEGQSGAWACPPGEADGEGGHQTPRARITFPHCLGRGAPLGGDQQGSLEEGRKENGRVGWGERDSQKEPLDWQGQQEVQSLGHAGVPALLSLRFRRCPRLVTPVFTLKDHLWYFVKMLFPGPPPRECI